ncbi:MAG: hypothetical protein K0Q49_1272 [Haloplasmataceae bacterium]|jgi:hypothetical protein|nr:hypothetical protein [Haloplasmataceae bacterium]
MYYNEMREIMCHFKEGIYYVGYVENLTFGNGTFAIARLYNPMNSNVNLHVHLWSISNLLSPLKTEIWENTNQMSHINISHVVAPANFNILPIPLPNALLQYASSVSEESITGVKLVNDNQKDFVFPPGKSFLLSLSNLDSEKVSAKIAFGWWEEPIY